MPNNNYDKKKKQKTKIKYKNEIASKKDLLRLKKGREQNKNKM